MLGPLVCLLQSKLMCQLRQDSLNELIAVQGRYAAAHRPPSHKPATVLACTATAGKQSLRWGVSVIAAAGKAKHYAFLEFHLPEVAKIAADAMDGYFLFKQVGTHHQRQQHNQPAAAQLASGSTARQQPGRRWRVHRAEMGTLREAGGGADQWWLARVSSRASSSAL